MILQVWFVEWSFREQNEDGTWPDEWEEARSPWKIFHSHDDAVTMIVKRVALAKDEKNGKVIKHEICPGDGWYYYEWEEEYNTYSGINKQHIMQISGYPRYVE